MSWKDFGDLECGHCHAMFTGTFKQGVRVKYEKTTVYCSPACRKAGMSARFRKPKPIYGPCPTCKKMFESRVQKTFCSMTCYVASPIAKARLKEIGLKGAQVSSKTSREAGSEVRDCLDCGAEFTIIKSSKKRFCNKGCWRSYLARRFDRWIASPERIALPQNFDEFLTMEELPCLVEGCSWTGAQLTLHMNQAHGVPASEFKRAAGFNLHTGVIGRGLANLYRERAPTGVALMPYWGQNSTKGTVRNYSSLEGREHRSKARALVCEAIEPPDRECLQCGRSFKQATPFGRAKYCSKECQVAFFKARAQARKFQATCAECGKPFLANRAQQLRQERGKMIFCSNSCKGRVIGAYPKPKRSAPEQRTNSD